MPSKRHFDQSPELKVHHPHQGNSRMRAISPKRRKMEEAKEALVANPTQSFRPSHLLFEDLPGSNRDSAIFLDQDDSPVHLRQDDGWTHTRHSETIRDEPMVPISSPCQSPLDARKTRPYRAPPLHQRHQASTDGWGEEEEDIDFLKAL